jgi:hypothetical protein
MGCSASAPYRDAVFVNPATGKAVRMDIALIQPLGVHNELQDGQISDGQSTFRGGIFLTLPTMVNSVPVAGIKTFEGAKGAGSHLKWVMHCDARWRGEQVVWAGYVKHDDKKRIAVLTSMGQFTLASGPGMCGCLASAPEIGYTVNVMSLQAAFVVNPETLQLVARDGVTSMVSAGEATAELFRLIWLIHTIGTGRQMLQHNVPEVSLPAMQLPPLPSDGGLHTSYMMHAAAFNVLEPELGAFPEGNFVPANWGQTQTSLFAAAQIPGKAAGGPTHVNENIVASNMIRKGIPMKALVLGSASAQVKAWKPACMQPLAQALRFNDTFKALIAEDTPSLGLHLAAFEETLKYNSSLFKLAFRNCGIQAQCAARLGAALESNRMSALAEIDLRSNLIGDAGAVALASAFEKKPNSLVRLLLSGCQIGEEGVTALLVRGLGQQAGLELLGLSGNSFGTRGSAALVPALSKLPSLTELGLGNAGLVASALLLENGAPPLRKLTTISLASVQDDALLKLLDPLPPKLSRVATDAPGLLQGLRALASARGGGAKNGLLFDLSAQPSSAVALQFMSSLGAGEDGVRGIKMCIGATDEVTHRTRFTHHVLGSMFDHYVESPCRMHPSLSITRSLPTTPSLHLPPLHLSLLHLPSLPILPSSLRRVHEAPSCSCWPEHPPLEASVSYPWCRSSLWLSPSLLAPSPSRPSLAS